MGAVCAGSGDPRSRPRGARERIVVRDIAHVVIDVDGAEMLSRDLAQHVVQSAATRPMEDGCRALARPTMGTSQIPHSAIQHTSSS
jgi:hypothetical protein